MTTRRILFDIETNGLLSTVTKVHCVSVRDLDTGILEYSVSPLDHESRWREVMDYIATADVVVGHNIVNFDIPVLKKLGWITGISGQVLDTLLLARLLFPDVKKQLDFDKHRSLVRRHGTKEAPEPKQYARIMGKHSLKAWGVRLGVHKGEFGGDSDDVWETWTPEMQVYMDQDTEVNVALWRYLSAEAVKWYGPEWTNELSVRIVHRTAEVCQRVEEHGWPFNEAAAAQLYAELSQQREDITRELVAAFGSWPVPGEVKTPVRNEPKYHRTQGCPYTPVRFVTFNPRSLDHIAKRLQDKYQWEPEELTPSGKPKLDEGVLGHLEDVYPEVSLLSRFLMVQKRIAALAEGDQAWMKHLRNGRVHASYMVNGTVSGRASHRSPNIAQVPAADVPYGPECRDLFTVPQGWVAIGADASGLELRCLSHYLAAFDGGSYASTVSQGDVHTANQKAAGLPSRSEAKTFIYAFLYGAGDRKIGSIVKPSDRETAQVFAGKALKSRFLKRTPGLQKLVSKIKTLLETAKYLKGLDGRRLYVRKVHAALNTLLQSAGAVICAAWMCRVDLVLQKDLGLKHGWDGDYVILGWIHDELQFAAKTPEIAEIIGKTAKQSIKEIGDVFDFRCPLDGEYKVGKSWKDTH